MLQRIFFAKSDFEHKTDVQTTWTRISEIQIYQDSLISRPAFRALWAETFRLATPALSASAAVSAIAAALMDGFNDGNLLVPSIRKLNKSAGLLILNYPFAAVVL